MQGRKYVSGLNKKIFAEDPSPFTMGFKNFGNPVIKNFIMPLLGR